MGHPGQCQAPAHHLLLGLTSGKSCLWPTSHSRCPCIWATSCRMHSLSGPGSGLGQSGDLVRGTQEASFSPIKKEMALSLPSPLGREKCLRVRWQWQPRSGHSTWALDGPGQALLSSPFLKLCFMETMHVPHTTHYSAHIPQWL